MPLIKSAKKRVRVSSRKSSINQLQRVGAKTATRLATNAVAASQPDATTLFKVAVSRLDTAAQKGVIHKNKAARLKSRLAAKLKAAGIPAMSPEAKPKAVKPAAKTTPKKAPAKKPAAKK
jgi:small subunit ribosomal protein S20